MVPQGEPWLDPDSGEDDTVADSSRSPLLTKTGSSGILAGPITSLGSGSVSSDSIDAFPPFSSLLHMKPVPSEGNWILLVQRRA